MSTIGHRSSVVKDEKPKVKPPITRIRQKKKKKENGTRCKRTIVALCNNQTLKRQIIRVIFELRFTNVQKLVYCTKEITQMVEKVCICTIKI